MSIKARTRRPRPQRFRPIYRRPHRIATQYLYDNGLRTVTLAEPWAQAIACSTALQETTGSIAKFLGSHTHTAPDYVVFMAPGFGFGGAAPVIWTPIANGFAFSGAQPFCWVQKCSDGKPSTHTTSVTGTLVTQIGKTRIEFSYEVLAFCGGTLVCTEEGAFAGEMAPQGPDPRNGSFSGKLDWTRKCCPDVEWKAPGLPV
jgi:hypothetical protein